MSTVSFIATIDFRHFLITLLLSAKILVKAHRKWEGILFFFFLIPASHAYSQSYNFRTFNSEDGLNQSYIYSISQDVHGHLWIGTGSGLSRYNGNTFETFPTGDSLTDSFITCSISDGENMWFGQYNSRLSFFDGKKNHTVNLHNLIKSPFTHFAKSHQGEIWASTYTDGLLKLDKASGVIEYGRFKEKTMILSFDFLDNGGILVGTNSGLLYCRFKESGEI